MSENTVAVDIALAVRARGDQGETITGKIVVRAHVDPSHMGWPKQAWQPGDELVLDRLVPRIEVLEAIGAALPDVDGNCAIEV